jgi:hypothetical protein
MKKIYAKFLDNDYIKDFIILRGPIDFHILEKITLGFLYEYSPRFSAHGGYLKPEIGWKF